MVKTTEQFLNELEEPYRTKALGYAMQSLLKEICDNQSDALIISFRWNETEEGFTFWNELYKTLQEEDDLIRFDENHKEDFLWESEQEDSVQHNFED